MGENATDVDKDIFNVEISEYVKRPNRLRANLENSYTLILVRCTEITHMHLEGLP